MSGASVSGVPTRSVRGSRRNSEGAQPGVKVAVAEGVAVALLEGVAVALSVRVGVGAGPRTSTSARSAVVPRC